jgi:DivIVA domain-containing protein
VPYPAFATLRLLTGNGGDDVALDRQSIERKDFPLARRGYDPAAVDAHLTALAGEVLELQRAAAEAQSPAASTLATSASDQVHGIIAAAETSAAEIRAKADTDAQQTLEQAHSRADELSRSSAALLSRLEETKRELEGVIASLRGGAAGLDADRGAAAEERHLHAVGPAEPTPAEPTPTEPTPTEPAPSSPTEPAPTADAPVQRASGDGAPVEPATGFEPAAAQRPPAEPAPAAPAPSRPTAPSPSAQDGTPDETEGARLVALNMALDGAPREQTAQYLSEHFRLADRDGLLDEVYSSVES